MSAASASAASNPTGNANRLLAAAYRADLADPAAPMFLDLDAAQILAEELEIGVEIFRVNGRERPSRYGPAIELGAILNEDLLDDLSGYALLHRGRHFSVLAPREDPEASQFAQWLKPNQDLPEQYVEAGESGPGGSIRPVPADGNCLITALYFVASENLLLPNMRLRFPDAAEVARLRAIVSRGLTARQVSEHLEEMREDLIRNAPERPWEGNRFAGWGPRASALLAADPDFMAARERTIEPHRRLQAALEAKRAAQREADAEAKEEAEAIALSIALGEQDLDSLELATEPETELDPDLGAGLAEAHPANFQLWGFQGADPRSNG